MSDTSKLMLSREQLATFLSDPDAIRKFERLFSIVDGAVNVVATEAVASAAYILFSNGLKMIWQRDSKVKNITTVYGAVFAAFDAWAPVYPLPTLWLKTTADYLGSSTANPFWSSRAAINPLFFNIVSPASLAAETVNCYYSAIGYT